MDIGGNSLASGPDGVKRKVSYFYEPEIGNYYYGQNHPMKPHRIRMTHALLHSYGLLKHMQAFKPVPARDRDLCKFHADDYVEFLRTVTPERQHEHLNELKRFSMGGDCPVFNDLYSFCQTYAGGSIGGAVKLNRGLCDIAINWAGGLHHAKKCEASGFCYINDIVLAILELLKSHERVLYVDIDVHHGDGVEEAFYTTDRVMTVSFHKFGNYFPGTGDIQDIGFGKGKYYSLNVPLDEGIDDESYVYIFKPIITKVMEVYKPEAVVLQCGADSLSGDRLGCFNLTIKGHSDCVKYMRSFNVPLLLLGGGGYSLRNVASCWCYETAVAVGVDVEDKLPEHRYYDYFGPDYTLHFPASNMENKNTRQKLDEIRDKLLENLSRLQHAPSVPFQECPPHTVLPTVDEDEQNPDERRDPNSDTEIDLKQKPSHHRVKQQNLWTCDKDPDNIIPSASASGSTYVKDIMRAPTTYLTELDTPSGSGSTFVEDPNMVLDEYYKSISTFIKSFGLDKPLGMDMPSASGSAYGLDPNTGLDEPDPDVKAEQDNLLTLCDLVSAMNLDEDDHIVPKE